MTPVRGDPYGDVTFERHDADRWTSWPVYWSPVWVGALAALAIALVIGLMASALGANAAGEPARPATYHDIRFGALFFGVFGAFAAFFAGGWIAARIAGIRRSEPAMLHGAIVWLVALPLLLLLMTLGAGSLYGSWYAGLAGTPAWVQPVVATAPAPVPPAGATARPAPSDAPVQADAEAARVARNTALGGLTAVLLGLVGGVLGGWAASGEPMTFTHYRRRDVAARYPERVDGREAPATEALVPPAIPAAASSTAVPSAVRRGTTQPA